MSGPVFYLQYPHAAHNFRYQQNDQQPPASQFSNIQPAHSQPPSSLPSLFPPITPPQPYVRQNAAGAMFDMPLFNALANQQLPFKAMEQATNQRRRRLLPKDEKKEGNHHHHHRAVFSEHQRLVLEREFKNQQYLDSRRKLELASELGLTDRQVKVWFQNRRAGEGKMRRRRENEQASQPTDVAPPHPDDPARAVAMAAAAVLACLPSSSSVFQQN